jgi:hypothetical protein
LILSLLLGLPLAVNWAQKGGKGIVTSPRDTIRARTASKFLSRQRPVAQIRAEDLTPYGRSFQPRIPAPGDRGGMVESAVGYTRVADGADRLRFVGPEYRAASATRRTAKGEGAPDGPTYVLLDEEAVARLGYDAVARDLQEKGARLLGQAPTNVLVVRAGAGALDAIAALPFVKAIDAVRAADRLSHLVGNKMFIQASRARVNTLDLEVALYHDADPGTVRGRMARIAGADNVSDYALDGRVLRVRSNRGGLARIASDPDVASVDEIGEFMLTNSEVPIIITMGNTEDMFNGARPFEELGIDGGGNDTNGDGARLNNGSDTVPPQIVAVTDNGISVDAVHFSQTLTQVSTLINPIGPSHRKVHSIQTVTDNGTSCDGLLSGSNTHGNVVAGIIAGAPGDFGLTFTKAIDPAEGEPLTGLSLDAVARGSRILMQDAGTVNQCTLSELIEVGGNVTPGNMIDRLNDAICPMSGGTGSCSGKIGGADQVHLQVLPFGVPNFDSVLNNPENGTYPLASAQIDQFLVNNRDYMVFSPAGHHGFDPGLLDGNPVWPDLFNGVVTDNDPNFPRGLQMPPPATAKNSVVVGATLSDVWTVFGNFNSEESDYDPSSKGPATAASLRTAPLVVATGVDGSGLFGYPLFQSATTNRSRDNDNLAPVEQEIDDQSFGTSFSAGYATGAGALVRDYFAQGFYPTATRQTTDRMSKVSGSLVRAALVASANFIENLEDPSQFSPNDLVIKNSRAVNIGTFQGVNVGIMGNGIQGYGRIILDQVLPISNYPPTRGIGAPNTVEYPAAGLIVYDMLGTGEPPIDNGSNTMTEKTFTVDGLNATGTAGAGRRIAAGQLRIALSWPDPPSAAGSGGTLINDLDLEVESPGPDNNIATTGDNVVYDGNVYIAAQPLPAGQWSQGRGTGDPDLGDRRNNIEAVHLSSFVVGSLPDGGNQLHTGTWKVRVKRGSGGAVAGQISGINQANEDLNNNGRRDATEPDSDSDGLLDAGGQPFALVVSGPVLGGGSQTWDGASHSLPSSIARFDKYQYSCADAVELIIADPDAGTNAGAVAANVVFEVVNRAGAVLDQERGFSFTAMPGGGFRSAPIPSRLLQVAAVSGNGVLEGDSGQFIVARYTDTPRSAQARARFQCTPAIIQGALGIAGRTNQLSFIGGGCDGDQFLDAGEQVTYSIALSNFELADDLTDVVARLTPTGPGAAAIRVLDSPKNFGRMPGGQFNAVTFTLFVDPTVANGLSLANRRVDLVLSLDGGARGVSLAKTSFTFGHVINANEERLHYSTDFPAGGREVRDYNRNLQIDKADAFDPFKQVFWPDEDVTFSSLWVPGTAGGLVTNFIGEDLNGNNALDPGEDLIPNAVLDRGILATPTGPTAGDRVPWNFDTNNGGWYALRSVFSIPGGISATPVWEHKTNGLCGFQTANAVGQMGIWHTGDSNPATPSNTAAACDTYLYPTDTQSPAFTEIYFDVLHSPIVQKVHQTNDARGFPWTVEFQRVGFNFNVQTADYSGGSFDLDNDIDSDARNCLVCQYLYTRFPDIYALVAFHSYNSGINPVSPVPQRTFGPLVDPDGSLSGGNPSFTGDEKGFSAFTGNVNPDSSSPIPTARPDFLPYPVPGAPQVCNPPGSTNPADCETNTVAGPERNFDIVLLEYEDGVIYLSLGPGQGEPLGAFAPGPARNRWQMGMGFFVQETTAADVDYGFGMDDVVLEWDEIHPLDDGSTAANPSVACSRFTPGSGPQQCATLAVDRLNLYECNETLEVTVRDARSAGQSTVTVFAVSDSDGTPVSNGVTTANHPRKSFTLPAVAGDPGLFRGNVTVGSLFGGTNVLFARSGDIRLTFYYMDPLCDADGDGAINELSFDNLDNDNIPGGTDNCPFLYNPGQEDSDGDGVGNLCDNCPGNANPGQEDGDADAVGNACDFDDADFDGVVNALDNCPDVYNPFQVPGGGGSTRGLACNQTSDRDGDGFNDRTDNCVRTYNPTQQNRDLDTLGDACDGDCLNPQAALLATGTCSRSNGVVCTSNAGCPSSGICQQNPTQVCTSSSPQCTCINIAPETCERAGLVNSGGCGTLNDDLDVDAVADAIDNCPVIYNPAVIPGTTRQADLDSDGRGDQCDPEQSVDDNNDALPDDALSFTTTVSCRKVPLGNINVLGTTVRDVVGDGDQYADEGETARMSVEIQNVSPFPLSDLTLILGSRDPDVSCVTKSSIAVPVTLQPGGTFNSASLGGLAGEFEFILSQNVATGNPIVPPRATFFLTITSNESVGTGVETVVEILTDLDPPSGTVPGKVAGPDGLFGTADDGLVRESFDTDVNGDGIISLSNLPQGTPGVLNDTQGVWVGNDPGGIGNVINVVGCAGFLVPPQDPECRIEPDFDMDWHIHCPAGSATCTANRTGHKTPSGGNHAFDGQNSVHWGHHFSTSNINGDTTKFRQMPAFMLNPINLQPNLEPGQLELSFYHIANMMDNNYLNTKPGHAVDYADVHISVDVNGDPTVDAWGFWERLVPFQNDYDHIPYIWSTFGNSPTYCNFTPTDAGGGGFAPRGVRELTCYPNGVWSHCGNQIDASTWYDCTGPGVAGALGNGLWVQSKFNLAAYAGQRVRIRWIAQSWEFDCCSSSYNELAGWSSVHDDGWWVDRIEVTGAIQQQHSAVPDTEAPHQSACPTKACNNTVGDNGFTMAISVQDTDGNNVVVAGEGVIVSAADTVNVGGCIGGGPQFRFFRNGVVVQDWSSSPVYRDNPTADATYRAQARCSNDPTCTSSLTSSAAQVSVLVYSGDGGDITLSVRHDRATATSTIEWLSRTQAPAIPQVLNYSLYAGTIPSSGASSLNTLTGIACLASVPQPGSGAGVLLSRTHNATPAVGQATYYLAGHNPTAVGPSGVLLGRKSNGTVRTAQPACP